LPAQPLESRANLVHDIIEALEVRLRCLELPFGLVRRACSPEMPAASSRMPRRFSGLAAISSAT
jgi:hypothetical protein